jgi:hypothetical protein
VHVSKAWGRVVPEIVTCVAIAYQRFKVGHGAPSCVSHALFVCILTHAPEHGKSRAVLGPKRRQPGIVAPQVVLLMKVWDAIRTPFVLRSMGTCLVIEAFSYGRYEYTC